MIHMVSTEQKYDGTWIWYCRCGATDGGHYSDQQFARNAGDKHLKKANA